MQKLFDFDDILIEPTIISPINSRSEVNHKTSVGTLPLMTAPMDTVIDEKNVDFFKSHGIIPILPRVKEPSNDYVSTQTMLSYSLDESERIFIHNTPKVKSSEKLYVLIDVANGHMSKLYELSQKLKQKYQEKMFLMVGNVANPETFYEYCLINVDAVRIGIGNGNGCLTTVQTGVGYPMGSLIYGCRRIKVDNKFDTKIVADGGFKKYSDIIKGLALGADYVMLGSVLNKALESAGVTTHRGTDDVVDQFSEETKKMFESDIVLNKIFRGMSTKEVQKSWGRDRVTTSEGVVRSHRVEYTLSGWTKNFEDYLKSAMSYTGKEKLHDFIGGVNFNFITENSFRRFDK